MKNEFTTCPRCGNETLKKDLVLNALSRYRDEYICSDCGVAEALAGYFIGHDNDYKWFIDD